MGIFKSVTKLLKKAAPVIGGAIGFGLGGGAFGAALGSGIGSLLGGGDTEDALKAAALGGIAGYAGQKFFGPAQGVAEGAKAVTTPASYGFEAASTPTVSAVSTTPLASQGIMSSLKDFATSPMGIASIIGAGGLATLGGEEEVDTTSKQPNYPEGRTRLGMGKIGDKFYNLDNEEERKQYFEDLRKSQKEEDNVGIFAGGGEVNGPGTGTSDSVPARLSDGEFVLTAKAVRGAGGGDRDLGAARMYDMMSELERVA
jgi:hypothetical protein